VVAAGQTRRADLQRASEKFSQAKVPLLGIVLNEVTRQNAYGSQYGSVSGYGYASYAADTPAANGQPHADGESATPARHGRQRQ
jgi:Mrp family chromosome partitioning ATPase